MEKSKSFDKIKKIFIINNVYDFTNKTLIFDGKIYSFSILNIINIYYCAILALALW